MGNLLKCLLGISTINVLANIFHTQLINKFKRKRGGKLVRVYFIIEM
jgi:ubiquitin C-terminal hydrolase